MVSNSSKDTLRRELRKQRAQKTPDERVQAQTMALSYLRQLRIYRAARRVALYQNMLSEFPTSRFFKLNHQMGKTSYLPVIGKNHLLPMRFAPYSTENPMKANRLGIYEPNGPIHERRLAKAMDLILVPLLGFDEYGTRLGMGGGYYDRALAFKQWQQDGLRPHLIGLAFDCQRVNKRLPREPWDIPLDAVITESGYLQISKL